MICMVFFLLPAAAQPARSAADLGRIIVLGDRAAYQLSEGLKSGLGDARVEFAGLGDVTDGFIIGNWVEILNRALETGDKPFAVIVLLSYNGDVGDGVYEVVADRSIAKTDWEKKVRPLISALISKDVPFFWVSSLPVPSATRSEHIEEMNTAIQGMMPASGIYVDIWSSFTDDDGRFAAVGPDIEGKRVPLRDSEGFGFSAAGARKAGYYVGVEVERYYKDFVENPKPAAPGEEKEISGVEANPLPLPRTTVSRVLPLSAHAIPQENDLIQETTALLPRDAISLRAMREGIPAPFRPNRGDDIRWVE
jgi:hypothetical protein